MKKTFLLSLFTFLISASKLFAQENFQDTNLALMEDVARNSDQKNIVEFLAKAKYEKLSESENDGVKSYIFFGPNSETMKVDYTKSKKTYECHYDRFSRLWKIKFYAGRFNATWF
ncbi:hypothetical protein SAMN05421796_102275 [Chryseobacterium piscicola]|uniref:Uncharacterized protein n=1 Tax=Chryseobacterium piscicola TaxID=551459 RepID=A0A1N7LFD6_9FLAO|nr:hypothetical protein [Chryseobacterium piscicola]PQA97587.1 hypothetical protein B0A70_02690 [Chryseobacterium piscicola]SIS72520.1 hypothetical protein SAMN05421796_102275 [Chryseobacterium piscicola]